MRRMEEDRLCHLRNLAEQYHQIMTDNRPKLVASSQRLAEPVQLCDISRDMEAVRKKVGNIFLVYYAISNKYSQILSVNISLLVADTSIIRWPLLANGCHLMVYEPTFRMVDAKLDVFSYIYGIFTLYG